MSSIPPYSSSPRQLLPESQDDEVGRVEHRAHCTPATHPFRRGKGKNPSPAPATARGRTPAREPPPRPLVLSGCCVLVPLLGGPGCGALPNLPQRRRVHVATRGTRTGGPRAGCTCVLIPAAGGQARGVAPNRVRRSPSRFIRSPFAVSPFHWAGRAARPGPTPQSLSRDQGRAAVVVHCRPDKKNRVLESRFSSGSATVALRAGLPGPRLGPLAAFSVPAASCFRRRRLTAAVASLSRAACNLHRCRLAVHHGGCSLRVGPPNTTLCSQVTSSEAKVVEWNCGSGRPTTRGDGNRAPRAQRASSL